MEYWWGRGHIPLAAIGHHSGITRMVSSSLDAETNLTMKLKSTLSMIWRGLDKNVPILMFPF